MAAPPTGTLRADYSPTYDQAIGGKADDVLAILNPSNPEWWTVRNARTGQQGFMPATFIVISDDVRAAFDRRIRERSPSPPPVGDGGLRSGLKLMVSAAESVKKRGADTVMQLDIGANIDADYFSAMAKEGGAALAAAAEEGAALAAAATTAAIDTAQSGVSAAQEGGLGVLAAAQDAKASVEQLQDERWWQVYEERRALWEQDMLPKWQDGQVNSSSRRIRRLVVHGIPHEVRPAVWMTVVGNELGLTRAEFESDYSAANPLSPGRPEGEVSAERLKAGRALIATDLERTFSKMGGVDVVSSAGACDLWICFDRLRVVVVGAAERARGLPALRKFTSNVLHCL